MQLIASLPILLAALASAAPAPTPVVEAEPVNTPIPTHPDYSGRCHFWDARWPTLDQTYNLWKSDKASCHDFDIVVQSCDKLVSGFCNVYP